MAHAYIVDAVRTAGGRRGGRLAGVHPVDLGAAVFDAIASRNDFDPKAIATSSRAVSVRAASRPWTSAATRYWPPNCPTAFPP